MGYTREQRAAKAKAASEAAVRQEVAEDIRIGPATKVDLDEPTVLDWDTDDDEAEDETPPTPAHPPVSTNDLAVAVKALADATRQNLESAPIRKVPLSRFKTRSPFNPTGTKSRKLHSRFYQNGGWVNIDKMMPQEIELFNTLSDLMKPGESVKVKDMLTFSKVQNGGNVDLHLIYKNKSNDDKLTLKSEFRHLRDMLEGGIEAAQVAISTVSRIRA